MSPTSQIIATVASLVFSAMMGLGAVLVLFKRPRALAEEMMQLLQDYARKSELSDLRADIQRQCCERHAATDKSLAELFRLDRARTKEITDRLDLINDSLHNWQHAIESRIGNHDGRLASLEKKL